jgi:preprotein translocase subunit SecY
MAIPSDYIQIIVAAIYAIALFYTIVTFQRLKRLDQITSLGDVMKELRDVERELEKYLQDLNMKMLEVHGILACSIA